MLKDMADSKRVDANIHNIAPQAMSPLRRARRAVRVDALSATIISSLFWPPHQVLTVLHESVKPLLHCPNRSGQYMLDT